MGGKRWATWEIELLKREKDPLKVSAITGRTIRAVNDEMHRLRIRSKNKKGTRRKYTDEQRREMIILYLHDMTQNAIAEKIGCSQTTVSKVVCDYFEGVISI